CVTNADCGAGSKFCEPNEAGKRVCTDELDTGYRACGKRAKVASVGAACTSACATCVQAPSLGAAFCSRGCSADAECGANAFCGKADSTTGNVCIPFECACVDASEENTLLDQTLAKAGKNVCDLGQEAG